MKICFLSQEYPSEARGGIGTYTYNMASALARLGHAVHVIISTQYFEHTFNDNGVWVHKIKKRKIKPKELQQMNYSYSVAKKLRQINFQFDIVQSSEFEGDAFWFSLNKRFPLVTRLATPFFLIEKLNSKMFFGPRPFFNWMEKSQTVNSDGIFTSTKALAEVVTEKWRIEPSRVEIIPNNLSISRVMQLGENEPPPDILKNKDFLLYFGRLEERKGVHILACALPAVLERFPDIFMVFVGSDLGYRGSPMKEYIKHNLGCGYSRKLIFFDDLPQERLFPIVNLAKLVILPSIWEAFGFVCVEAMALGRPVVATSGSGFEEIIEDNISGYLVEPGNSALLAEKIINVLRDEPSLRQISENARNRAQDFEVSKGALKLIGYYEKIREKWSKKERRINADRK